MVNAHPLALVKSIVDPIHGLVRMTMEEHLVMDHRVFQRMRRIKQNGLLHLVFPSATHNRFEHSLGVMFVADSVLQALLFNSQAAAERLYHPAEAEAGQALDLTRLDDGERVTRWLFQVTRLAALVHDLGHGALSHAFDKFAPPRAGVRRLLAAPELTALAPLHEILVRYPKNKPSESDDAIAHEALSCILFAYLWQDLATKRRDLCEPSPDWLPLAVAAAILGPEAHDALDTIPLTFRRLLPLISDIIASAPVDADRMDYMERDSRSCGVSYGLFDRHRILKSALVFRDHHHDSFRLGWKLSGLRTIEDFLHARFQLYAQIYYHKTNMAANLMLDEIAEYLRACKRSIIRIDDLSVLIDDYCELGDEALMARLLDRSQPDRVRELAAAVQRRALWKRIHESTAGLSARSVEKFLTDRDPDLAKHLKLKEAKLQATKDLEKGARLLERDKNNHYCAPEKQRSWLDRSPLLNTLHHEEKKIERLYWTGDREHGHDLAERARRLTAESD